MYVQIRTTLLNLLCTLSNTIQQVFFALHFIMSLHLSLYSSKCCFFVTLIANPLYCKLPSSKTGGRAVNTTRNQPGSTHLISEPGVTYTLWSINFLKSAVIKVYIKVIWHNYIKMLLQCFVMDCRIQFYTGRHYGTSNIQMYAGRHYGTSHIQMYVGRHYSTSHIQLYTERHYSTSHIQLYTGIHYSISHIQLDTGRHYRTGHIQMYARRHYSTGHIHMYAGRPYSTGHIHMYAGRDYTTSHIQL